MDFSVAVGFLLGAASMLLAEGIVLYWILQKLTRINKAKKMPVDAVACDLNVEQRPTIFPYEKQGSIWVLEPEKLASQQNASQIKTTKEQKNKRETIEVSPIKKKGKIQQHNLILTDPDGSQTTIQLLDCRVETVSASTMPSRKWVKKYPIRVQSMEKNIYNGSKICYLYLETSWEKEAWCKALRLASFSSKEKINWYAQLSEEFHCYLASLNTVYPLLFKPSVMPGDRETTNNTNKDTDGNPSKFRYFLKKIAKKASKSSSEPKSSIISSSSNKGERKFREKNLQDHRAPQPNYSTKYSSVDKSSSHDPPQPNHSTKYCSAEKSSSHDPPQSNHSTKYSSVEKSSSEDLPQPNFSTKNPPVEESSSQEPLQPNPPTFTLLESQSVHSFGDVWNEKSASEFDEGAVFLNLLFSRLFFDIKRNMSIGNFIKERIQRMLSHMRTPSYIGAITCTGIDLGNRPPYLHSIKALPIDMNEGWAVDVEIEYSGYFLLEIETRLDAREPEVQKSIVSTSNEPGSGGDATSDLLKETLNDYSKQFNLSSDSEGVDGLDEENKLDILRQPKGGSWTSRWRTILKNVADHVSQVPLSLEVKIVSLRGTLRLQIKPPPSDHLWIGFTTMPEIDLNLNSCIGDHKIVSTHIAMLISNRFKAAIRDSLVLPNCESIRVPFMSAENNDWIPRSAGPFVWTRQESGESSQKNASKSQSMESKAKCKSLARSMTIPVKIVEPKEVEIRNTASLPSTLREPVLQCISSEIGSASESLAEESTRSNTAEDLGKLSLRNDEIQKTSSLSMVESSYSTTPSTYYLTVNSNEEDAKAKKMGKKERIKDFGKKMSEKFDEKIRHIEEKGRQIVENVSNDTSQTLSFSSAEIATIDNIRMPLLTNADYTEFPDNNSESSANSPENETKAKKTGREKMRDLRKKMGEKLEEKKRHIVVKMKENSKTPYEGISDNTCFNGSDTFNS